jgi:hypothetical protein
MPNQLADRRSGETVFWVFTESAQQLVGEPIAE